MRTSRHDTVPRGASRHRYLRARRPRLIVALTPVFQTAGAMPAVPAMPQPTTPGDGALLPVLRPGDATGLCAVLCASSAVKHFYSPGLVLSPSPSGLHDGPTTRYACCCRLALRASQDKRAHILRLLRKGGSRRCARAPARSPRSNRMTEPRPPGPQGAQGALYVPRHATHTSPRPDTARPTSAVPAAPRATPRITLTSLSPPRVRGNDMPWSRM